MLRQAQQPCFENLSTGRFDKLSTGRFNKLSTSAKPTMAADPVEAHPEGADPFDAHPEGG